MTSGGYLDQAGVAENIRENLAAAAQEDERRRQQAEDVAAGRRLASTPLHSDYAGEDVSAGFQSALNPNRRDLTVAYDRDEDAQEASRVHVAEGGGLLCDAQGAPLSGTYGWVMDPATGYLHVFEEEMAWVTGTDGSRTFMDADAAKKALNAGALTAVATTHHSTMLAGAPVAGAGQITLAEGVITSINDVSGHYRPDGDITSQAVGELVAQDLAMSHQQTVDGMTGPVSARIGLLGAESPDGFHAGKTWVGDDPTLYQGMVELTPEQYMQTAGNEGQIRRKAMLNETIDGAGINLQENLHAGHDYDGPGDPQEDQAEAAQLGASRLAAAARMSMPLADRQWAQDGPTYDAQPDDGFVGGLESGHYEQGPYEDEPPPESW